MNNYALVTPMASEALPDYARLPVLCPQRDAPSHGIFVRHDPDAMVLVKAGEAGRVCVDFTAGKNQYRRLKGGGELIARAVNVREHSSVWDATAGLGQDAFVLASLGMGVSLFEQHAVVFCLLADGLARAQATAELADIGQRMSLHWGDACVLMPKMAQAQRPDVVYLDPMYPARHKSAAVKKSMAYFHELVGAAQDESQLLAVARHVAKKRVVVKRPRLGAYLAQQRPDYQYQGTSTRFDVYLPHMPLFS